MDPFGSDTRRYNMHCKCHSTSIRHSWGPFFTFRLWSSIIFMKIVFKAMPSWPHRCIKSLKSIGKMNVFRNWTKVTTRQPSCTSSYAKVTLKCPKVAPEVLQSNTKVPQSGFKVVQNDPQVTPKCCKVVPKCPRMLQCGANVTQKCPKVAPSEPKVSYDYPNVTSLICPKYRWKTLFF